MTTLQSMMVSAITEVPAPTEAIKALFAQADQADYDAVGRELSRLDTARKDREAAAKAQADAEAAEAARLAAEQAAAAPCTKLHNAHEAFERVTCSRCGGSGNYSYCQRYGTVCFKCGGRKAVYSARGYAAALVYEALLSRPAGLIKPGMLIKGIGVTVGGDVYSQWEKVTEVRPGTVEDGGHLVDGAVIPSGFIIVTNKCVHHAEADSMYRIGATAEQKERARTAALSYMAKLTKAGKPRKR
jgi:hypothetical protein